MRKPAFCICENKDADQLRGNREADQRLCFRYTDSTIPLLPKSEISSCTARFVSDLVGNLKDQFSHNEAQIIECHARRDDAVQNHDWVNLFCLFEALHPGQ